MKKKFFALSSKIRLIVIIALYALATVSLFLITASDFFFILFALFLAAAIILTKWNKKAKELTGANKTIIGGPDKKVPVVDENGSIVYYSKYDTVEAGYCLYHDGGRKYHTHVGCFDNWKEEMKRDFTCWKLITLEEAQKMGMSKCRFCEEADKNSK